MIFIVKYLLLARAWRLRRYAQASLVRPKMLTHFCVPDETTIIIEINVAAEAATIIADEEHTALRYCSIPSFKWMIIA